MTVRVRFAPSPTGHFHIGGARTALYNVLLAQQTGGRFILRIEDTDTKRSTPEALVELQEALRWLGLHWQEGPDIGGPHAPYNQTARKAIYQDHAQQLVASGQAYYCFCSTERLKELREGQQQRKESPRYDGLCRRLDSAEAQARVVAGERHVIRFKAPTEGATTVHDHLRGDITVDNSTIDDFILVKSDGLAVYHLAAMVDDHRMGITHVLRSSEWLGTFPLHALIIRAFGWQEPVWCHLSVFLKPNGKGKMSKRDVTSEQSIFVLQLREMGYLPEAVNNWIALMGASFGSEEHLLSMAEMTDAFSLDHLNPSPARVNFEKLDDINGKWIRRLDADDLAARVRPFLVTAGFTVDDVTLHALIPLIRERLVTLDDVIPFAGFFFQETVTPAVADLLGKKLTPVDALTIARRSLGILSALPDLTHSTAEPPLRALVDELGQNAGAVFGLVRVAVTGQTVSPPLFESMAIIGREKVLARLRAAIALLEK